MRPFRFNNIQVQNKFLKQIPRLADITLPTNYLDWKSKQLSLPLNLKDVARATGRHDRGFAADEPQYLLIRSDEENPSHLGILN